MDCSWARFKRSDGFLVRQRSANSAKRFFQRSAGFPLLSVQRLLQRTANSVLMQADLNSLQRTPNSWYSEALTLSLLGTWNRQHGTVLHSDQRVFRRTANRQPTTIFSTNNLQHGIWNCTTHIAEPKPGVRPATSMVLCGDKHP